MSSHHCRNLSILSGKQVLLRGRIFRLFGAGLVHLFDGLKGQNDVADLIGLAVPDKLDLALVLEKQEAVFFRQGLISLDKPNNVLLFLLGKSRHFPALWIQSISIIPRFR
jgi:hypothetical protein